MLLGMVPKHSRMAGHPTKPRRGLHTTMVSGTGHPAAGWRLMGTCSWVQAPEDMAMGWGREACGLQQCLKKMSVPPPERRALGMQPLIELRNGC